MNKKPKSYFQCELNLFFLCTVCGHDTVPNHLSAETNLHTSPKSRPPTAHVPLPCLSSSHPSEEVHHTLSLTIKLNGSSLQWCNSGSVFLQGFLDYEVTLRHASRVSNLNRISGDTGSS